MIMVVRTVSQFTDQNPPRFGDGLRQERQVVLDIRRRVEFVIRLPRARPSGFIYSRTNIAMLNTITVSTNAVKNAAGTTSR